MISQTDKIIGEINHYRRQIILNHENAQKKQYRSNKFLMDKNLGEFLHQLKHFDEYLEKNREIVKIIGSLVQEYYTEIEKELIQ